MRRLQRLLSILAVATAATALATPAHASQGAGNGVHDHFQITITSGPNKGDVEGFVSTDYLAAHPHALDKVAPTTAYVMVARVTGQVIPASAAPCDEDVCMDVTGSGLHVSAWSTTAYVSGPLCTHPRYDIYIPPDNPNYQYGPTELYKHPTICEDSPNGGVFYSSTTDLANRNYVNNTYLANAWLSSSIPGYPNVHVHS